MSAIGDSPPLLISEPTIPFLQPTKLTLGRLYTIRGIVTHDAHRFSVNFLFGGREGNVAVHIDTRFDQKIVVRNSRIGDSWQAEERSGRLPLTRGQKFTMMILVENARYMIAYNDQHFTEYLHRIPPCLIDNIQINGDVRVSMYVETQGTSSLPPPLPRLLQTSWYKDKVSTYTLPEPMSSAQRVLVSGVPKRNTFNLNIETNDTRTGDIALHISCRFGWFPEVVINNCVGGVWGKEVRPSNLRLQTGKQFVFEICAVHDEYRVVLDGCYTVAFPDRGIKASSVTALSISGDVVVSFVSY